MLKQAVPMTSVYEGMDVFDRTGERIGTVKAFRQGEGTIKTQKMDNAILVDTIRSALGLGTNKHLPASLYIRLFDEGFICIKRGFLKGDVIVVPNQIEEIGENRINLNIERTATIKV